MSMGATAIASPVRALVQRVVDLGWYQVDLTDGDGTAYDINSLDTCYRNLCGPARLDQYDSEFFEQHVRTQRWHAQVQIDDLLTEHGLDRIFAWLDNNVRLSPGLKQHVDQPASRCGLVLVSNNVDVFAGRIIIHNQLFVPGTSEPIPFLANHLTADGRVETVHGEDGLDKGLVLCALLEAGVKVRMVAGDSKSDWGMARIAYQHQIPVFAFGETVGQGDLGSWCAAQGIPVTRVNNWYSVTQLLCNNKV